MKIYQPCIRNLKRLSSLDALIIVLCDLGFLGVLALIGYYTIGFINQISNLLSNVVLSKQMMLSNPSIANMNLVLLQQATKSTYMWFCIVVIVVSVSLAVLNYIQWSRVASYNLKTFRALWFIITESIWYLCFFIIMIFSIFKIFDPAKIQYIVSLMFILLAHISLGLQVGILSNIKVHRKKLLSTYIKSIFRPVFSNLLRWFVVYGLLFASLFICFMLSSILGVIGLSPIVSISVLGFVALAWWRMMMFELMTQ